MEWIQVATIISFTVGCTYIFYKIVKDDIARHDAELKDMRLWFNDVRQEFSRRDALWADLLKEIHDIKLFQATKLTK